LQETLAESLAADTRRGSFRPSGHEIHHGESGHQARMLGEQRIEVPKHANDVTRTELPGADNSLSCVQNFISTV
jgi:hypothetical protein